MRVSTSEADAGPEYPKLLSYRGMVDPTVILALSPLRSVVLVQGAGSYVAGSELGGAAAELWQHYKGAVTLQN